MKHYIGTKSLLATAMVLGAYNELRGWNMPADEDPEAEGYLVEYEPTEENKPNHPDFGGYISWSPKAVFEESYRANGELTCGHAIHALKKGLLVRRRCWPTGYFVFRQVPALIGTDIIPKMQSLPAAAKSEFGMRDRGISYDNQLAVVNGSNEISGYGFGSEDALAEDWEILEQRPLPLFADESDDGLA